MLLEQTLSKFPATGAARCTVKQRLRVCVHLSERHCCPTACFDNFALQRAPDASCAFSHTSLPAKVLQCAQGRAWSGTKPTQYQCHDAVRTNKLRWCLQRSCTRTAPCRSASRCSPLARTRMCRCTRRRSCAPRTFRAARTAARTSTASTPPT